MLWTVTMCSYSSQSTHAVNNVGTESTPMVSSCLPPWGPLPYHVYH